MCDDCAHLEPEYVCDACQEWAKACDEEKATIDAILYGLPDEGSDTPACPPASPAAAELDALAAALPSPPSDEHARAALASRVLADIDLLIDAIDNPCVVARIRSACSVFNALAQK